MRGSADRLLARVVGLDRPRLAAIVVTALVATAAGLLLPSALAAAVDAVVAGRPSWPEVSWLLLVGGAEIAADVVGGILTTRVTATASAWLRRTLSDKLFALGTRSKFAEGDAISRLTGDCVGAGGIVTIVVQCGSMLVISSGAVVLLAFLDWRLALVFLGSIPFALLLARSHLKHTADDVLAYQQVSGELAARMVDAVALPAHDRRVRHRRPRSRTRAAPAAEADPGRDGHLAHAGPHGLARRAAHAAWVELAVLAAAGFGVLATASASVTSSRCSATSRSPSAWSPRSRCSRCCRGRAAAPNGSPKSSTSPNPRTASSRCCPATAPSTCATSASRAHWPRST